MEVKKGIIVDLRIISNTIPRDINILIQNKIINSLHHPATLKKILKNIDENLKSIGMDSTFLFNLFF